MDHTARFVPELGKFRRVSEDFKFDSLTARLLAKDFTGFYHDSDWQVDVLRRFWILIHSSSKHSSFEHEG